MGDTLETRLRHRIVKNNHLDFLYELHQKGIDISEEHLVLLRENNYIKNPDKETFKHKNKKLRSPAYDDSVKSDGGRRSDVMIDIVEGDPGEQIVSRQEFDKATSGPEFIFQGDKEITRDDWAPESVIVHKKEFVEFIDSINSGFRFITKYKPFILYVQQSRRWISDGGGMNNYSSRYDMQQYAIQEYGRCRENTLYFLDKYLELKEGDMSSGSRKYIAKPVHEVMCFLIDCGYSIMMGKPRQIAATTTIGGCALQKMLFNMNYFVKFITQDKETGVEIFDDKFKYPFSELPKWMKPSVANERDNLFVLDRKEKKGTKEGVGSRFQIVAPSVSAINGGSPQCVMVDEAGYIGILGRMIGEARPTMFWQDPVTKILQVKRQILIWGTGGHVDQGGKAYEEEFSNAMKAWKERHFKHIIIPIFFDWTTRPGITREHYETEKKVFTVEGPDKEKKAIQFRQHYPSNIEDMFLTSAKTLVSIDWVNDNIDRILNTPHKERAKYGFFEPVYDYNVPMDENSDTPYKIIDATFTQTEGPQESRTSTIMFSEPKSKWKDRYFQGTDPIASDNGYSNMGSSVFDDYFKTTACIVDYRSPNHKETFLQVVLMGLYYDTEKKQCIPELLESNIGTAYADYKEAKGFRQSLVYQAQLPEFLRGGSQLIGIDNRGRGSGTGNRSRMIINKMYEFYSAYGERLYIMRPFEQLKTFVCTITDKGSVTWGTKDKRSYHDDLLFADTYSYICPQCFNRVPKKISGEHRDYKMRYEVRRNADGMLTRVPVRVAG